MKTFLEKKIGIWGFGIVGQSALRYLSPYARISITDKNTISEHEKNSWPSTISWYDYTKLNQFLDEHHYILPSPGVDLRPYYQYSNKWLSEIDIFFNHFKKKTIAVTGSAGKTSVVHLLSQILVHTGYSVVTGGNIGVGMLDFLNIQKNYDYALLELSSFQLALATNCTPDLAIITNIFPNHLDRHSTLGNYIQAKLHILAKQTDGQYALVPYALIPELKKRTLFERNLAFFSLHRPKMTELLSMHTLFFIENNTIIKWQEDKEIAIYACTQLPSCSFPINWLIIIATLSMLEMPLTCALEKTSFLTIPEHRLELIAIKNGVTFYNDSKSTLPAATLAALNTLQNKLLLLLLGGISKRINRQQFIQKLPSNIKHIICFGAEASELKHYCDDRHLPVHAYATLEEAFKKTIALAQAEDCVLFSPAGASYDLFKNYEERGNYFKKLVASMP